MYGNPYGQWRFYIIPDLVYALRHIIQYVIVIILLNKNPWSPMGFPFQTRHIPRCLTNLRPMLNIFLHWWLNEKERINIFFDIIKPWFIRTFIKLFYMKKKPLVTLLWLSSFNLKFDKWVDFTNVKVPDLHIPVYSYYKKNTSCSLYAVANMDGYKTDDILLQALVLFRRK